MACDSRSRDARRPEVRALALRVYEAGKRRYLVPGRQRIYAVFVLDGMIFCSCTAASFGRECSHRIAVAHFIESRKDGGHSSAPR